MPPETDLRPPDRHAPDTPPAPRRSDRDGGVPGTVAKAASSVVGNAVDVAASVVGTAVDAAATVVGGAAGAAASAAQVAGEAASTAVDAAEGAASSVATVAGGAATGVKHRWSRSSAARSRQLRARSRQPLASLWVAHPEARHGSRRELGVRTVSVDRILGTAVHGPPQRGGDFLPFERLRGTNWQGRWQRIRNALERLETLPPVDVLKYGDGYWVVDGHNRVAAALYADQVALDASVVELRDAGKSNQLDPDTSLEGVLAQGRELRAVGRGRLSRTATVRDPLGKLTDRTRSSGDGEHEHG